MKLILAILATCLASTHLAAAPAASASFVGSPVDWFSEEDYPADALHAGLEGKVEVLLHIDTAGHIATCDISGSSGHDVLDRKTCEVLQRKGRYLAARDRRGRTLAGQIPVSINWRIPPPEPSEMSLMLELAIGETDKIETCSASWHSESACAQGGESALSTQVIALLRKAGVIGRFNMRSLTIYALTTFGNKAQMVPDKGWVRMSIEQFEVPIDETGQYGQCILVESFGPDRIRHDMCKSTVRPNVERLTSDGGNRTIDTLYIATAIFVDGAAGPLVSRTIADGMRARMIMPRDKLVSENDYPAEAKANRSQGSALAEWKVDIGGGVTDCRIVETSGYAVLDQTTCRLIVERAHYVPARNAMGQPIVSTDRGRFTWSIPLPNGI